MTTQLPLLIYEDLYLTRNYLQDVALVLGAVQRAYLPQHERDWQHGLEVSMRGLTTQPFMLGDQQTRILLDLVRQKIRIGDTHWSLEEYAAPELLKNIKVWLAARGEHPTIEQPTFSSLSRLDTAQAEQYAEALWWLDARFRELKPTWEQGITSPIYVYPHHFDLSLVWFPKADDSGLSLGFSTGDETIAEPYLYATMYPEHADFAGLDLPEEAHWQTTGFHGAVLPYAALQTSQDPKRLFADFAAVLTTAQLRLA